MSGVCCVICDLVYDDEVVEDEELVDVEYGGGDVFCLVCFEEYDFD